MVGVAIVAQAAVLGSSVGLHPSVASMEACSIGSSSSSSGLNNVGLWSSSSLVGRGRARGVRVERRQTRLVAQGGWFKFGSNGMDSEGAGIYGSQKREDFDRDDVEQVEVAMRTLSYSFLWVPVVQYFNYMGMLATEGTYDKMEALLNIGIQAIDILLLLASSEGDVPKIEELLRAGADCRVKDDQGRTALDRAADEDIRELILSKSQAKV